MKYTYKLKKTIYYTVEFENEVPNRDSVLEPAALAAAKAEENDNPMELLCDGDEWEVEELEEDEAN
jgi:hypothetical protein